MKLFRIQTKTVRVSDSVSSMDIIKTRDLEALIAAGWRSEISTLGTHGLNIIILRRRVPFWRSN